MKIDTKYQWLLSWRKWSPSLPDGYLIAAYKHKNKYLHRVIWAFEHNIPYSEVPMLDHINRDPTDNRLCNLRVTNHILNNNNSEARMKGNCYKLADGWRSQLVHRKKMYRLGLYPTEAMARLISRGVKTYLMIFEEAIA